MQTRKTQESSLESSNFANILLKQILQIIM